LKNGDPLLDIAQIKETDLSEMGGIFQDPAYAPVFDTLRVFTTLIPSKSRSVILVAESEVEDREERESVEAKLDRERRGRVLAVLL